LSQWGGFVTGRTETEAPQGTESPEVVSDIASSLVMGKPLNYSLVSVQTAEINKRASRLNVYMLARSPESKEQNISAELKKEGNVAPLRIAPNSFQRLGALHER